MKKFFVMMMILMVSVLVAGAQSKLVSHNSFGSKAAYEVTLTNDTVEFIPQYTTTAYIMPVDTNVVIQADTLKAKPGNLVYFQVTTDATKRYVKFDSGFTTNADSLSASKTRTWGFVFVRGKFVQINRSAEY